MMCCYVLVTVYRCAAMLQVHCGPLGYAWAAVKEAAPMNDSAPGKRTRANAFDINDPLIEEVRKRRDAGEAYRKIAKDVGVAYMTVYRFCNSPRFDAGRRRAEAGDKRECSKLNINDLTIKHTSGRALTLVCTSLRVNPDGSEVHEFSVIVGPAE